MAAIIELRDLTKQYGELTAVDALNLRIEEGAVFGFIGPNGAGKTTTMRMLTTLLRPTSGEAYIAGHSVIDDPHAVRRVIGYMPDFFGVYEDMKVWEYLDFFAACYDILPAARSGIVDDLLALVDLSHKREAYVETLSRGMKQRLCLARTLTHDPQVLILDEPAGGLDPRARIELRELLRELQKMGKTIFFSSHILSEVADICTSIGVLENGRLVAAGNVSEMMARLRAHRLITMRFVPGAAVDVEEAMLSLRGEPGVQSVTAETGEGLLPKLQIDFSGDDVALSELLARAIGRGWPVLAFNEESGDLEDVFLQVTKGTLD
ncbi:MAG: ABC transporter ATP-binding protein [Chloroflexota bacterium]